MVTDVTRLIERFELFEERVQIDLKGLFGLLTSNPNNTHWVTITGELHYTKGMTLERDIRLVTAIYDDLERVVATNNTTWFLKKDFYGFKVFESICFVNTAKLKKITIYPEAF